MSDLILSGASTYASGVNDTATTVVNNSLLTPIDAKHPNGLASAILQIEAILGTGTALKGSLADLVARLAVQMSPAGVIIPPGVIWPYGGAAAPTGFIMADGIDKSRTTYPGLFAAYGTTWGAGDGSTTFGIPKGYSRMIVGAGTGTVVATGTDPGVTIATDTLAVNSNTVTWITGMAVAFTLSSGTITGLTSGNTYYIIRDTTVTVKLASSLANAQNGTAIDLTAKSSPVWTLTHTLPTRTLGEYGGEAAHAQSSIEQLSHTHTVSALSSLSGGGSFTGGSGFGNAVTIGNTGGNAAMNIMNPFLTANYIIKT
jgi:microcystin-dependent protein